jgi:hypothetical protein
MHYTIVAVNTDETSEDENGRFVSFEFIAFGEVGNDGEYDMEYIEVEEWVVDE